MRRCGTHHDVSFSLCPSIARMWERKHWSRQLPRYLDNEVRVQMCKELNKAQVQLFQVSGLTLKSMEAAIWVLVVGLISSLGLFFLERLGRGRKINVRGVFGQKKQA